MGRGSVAGPLVGSLPPKTQTIGPGVRSLIRGQHAEAALAEPTAAAPTQTEKPTIPRWYLFAGDILLVALAMVVIFRHPRPGWKEEVFAIIAVALGGGLGVKAVLMQPPVEDLADDPKIEN